MGLPDTLSMLDINSGNIDKENVYKKYKSLNQIKLLIFSKDSFVLINLSEQNSVKPSSWLWKVGRELEND